VRLIDCRAALFSHGKRIAYLRLTQVEAGFSSVVAFQLPLNAAGKRLGYTCGVQLLFADREPVVLDAPPLRPTRTVFRTP